MEVRIRGIGSEMGILRRIIRSMVRAICGVHLKEKRINRFDVYVGFQRNHWFVSYGKQFLLIWSCLEKSISYWGWRSKDVSEAKEDMEKAGWWWNCEGWFEKEGRTLPIKVVCWCKSDWCCVEVNLVTLTCWKNYQILKFVPLFDA